MEVTLTRLKTKTVEYGCSMKDFINRIGDWSGKDYAKRMKQQGTALLEVKWQRTTDNRIIVWIPKQSKIFIG
jgi:hypothetical protein